ncbi:MAG: hypothetical protein L3J70_03280 [Gammaproteobacteria bacterium]|nr:hypothetical protein [Gammaproteobacteria bacterium]
MKKNYIKKGASRHYVGGSDIFAYEAQALSENLGGDIVIKLQQRGAHRGWVSDSSAPQSQVVLVEDICDAWKLSEPIVLSGFIDSKRLIEHETHIDESYQLVSDVLDDEECNELLSQPPYFSRLSHRFEILSSIYDENDPQAIEKIECDVIEEGKVVAENLWLKLSWLSFVEKDASLRFRFSFGLESYEDVAADPARQQYAAEFTEAIFPESALISRNEELKKVLCKVLGAHDVSYVERIIFFNAPEGGAQFHQDIEKGHQGVVYAQLSGRTGWLTLSKQALVDEIQFFLSRPDASSLMQLVNNTEEIEYLYSKALNNTSLSVYLDEQDNEPLEKLINRLPAFAQQLVERGHFYIVNPGDVVLLPQQDIDHCAWHAVLCLDDFIGEGLSFAVRKA